MNDEQTYQRYCRWCRSLGIEPASFVGWKTGAGSHSSADQLQVSASGVPRNSVRYTSTAQEKQGHFWLFVIVAVLLLLTIIAMHSVTAICKDGSKSFSTGQGTCSWHGGVKEWE
jgi:hypothetical protein